jgi:hypothetical protein
MDDAELTDRHVSAKISIDCQLDPNYKDASLFNSAPFTFLLIQKFCKIWKVDFHEDQT